MTREELEMILDQYRRERRRALPAGLAGFHKSLDRIRHEFSAQTGDIPVADIVASIANEQQKMKPHLGVGIWLRYGQLLRAVQDANE